MDLHGDLYAVWPAGRMGVVAVPAKTALALASMLDLNGDGDPLDDILRMARKAMR